MADEKSKSTTEVTGSEHSSPKPDNGTPVSKQVQTPKETGASNKSKVLEQTDTVSPEKSAEPSKDIQKPTVSAIKISESKPEKKATEKSTEKPVAQQETEKLEKEAPKKPKEAQKPAKSGKAEKAAPADKSKKPEKAPKAPKTSKTAPEAKAPVQPETSPAPAVNDGVKM